DVVRLSEAVLGVIRDHQVDALLLQLVSRVLDDLFRSRRLHGERDQDGALALPRGTDLTDDVRVLYELQGEPALAALELARMHLRRAIVADGGAHDQRVRVAEVRADGLPNGASHRDRAPHVDAMDSIG